MENTQASPLTNEKPRKTVRCSTCGNELGAQALFCGKCGTPVVSEESPIEDSLESKSPAAQRRGRSAAAAEVTGAVSDTAPVTSRASFKGAMDTSHRKARRKMPILVLVALFMLSASTVAWAVYTLINPVVANEREIDWTPQSVYEAMEPERFDLKTMLENLLAETRGPSVRVKIPASIAEPEGDRLNFVIEEDDDEARIIIYYRMSNNENNPQPETH